MVQHHEVTTTDGETIPLKVDSICLHGDTPGAVTLARAVCDRLADAGVRIDPFCERERSHWPDRRGVRFRHGSHKRWQHEQTVKGTPPRSPLR